MSTSVPERRDGLPPRLGRYDVRAKIGDGGMASVYLGRLAGPPGMENAFERVVALKVIKEEYCRNPEFTTMFLDEAKIVSRLSHPNLVQVIELGKEGDRLFIAMELLAGQSLWQVWDGCRDRGVRLRYDMAAWIGARVAEGLHHAHEMRDPEGHPLMLVHRDVNATNIFVTYDGHVKVIDFGLAKARNRLHKTAAGVVKGKLAYLSPEQISGQGADRRSDVFALGTTLWELTTDRRLFRVKDDAETVRRVHAANVPDPTTLVDGYPPILWQVIKRALARDPNARYATAADFARALDEFARSEGRHVDALSLADVMRQLFAAERERDAAWLAEASSPHRPAPIATMHPPQPWTAPPPPADMMSQAAPVPAAPRMPSGLQPAAQWPQGAPPDGMFSPPSRSPAEIARAGAERSFVAEPTRAATPLAIAQPRTGPSATGGGAAGGAGGGAAGGGAPRAGAPSVPGGSTAGGGKVAIVVAIAAFVMLVLVVAAGLAAAFFLRHRT